MFWALLEQPSILLTFSGAIYILSFSTVLFFYSLFLLHLFIQQTMIIIKITNTTKPANAIPTICPSLRCPQPHQS